MDSHKTISSHFVGYRSLKWIVGCIAVVYLIGSQVTTAYADPLHSPLLQRSGQQDNSWLVGIALLAWIGSAIWGMVNVARKGYLSGLTWNVGCILFIFVGWWAILILLILGPIWLGIAALLPTKRTCPYCKNKIAGSAIRCQYCHADLTITSIPPTSVSLPPVASPMSGQAAAVLPVVTTQTCPTCHAPRQAEARFCIICGLPFNPVPD